MAKFPALSTPAVLSPMAGVTDVAFRTLCRRYGAGLTYTEFVSSAAIVRGNRSSLRMLTTDPSEKPVAVQLFGNNTEEVVAAAQAVEQRFDVIDINCGCPAWKVIRTGAGSEMLKQPQAIFNLISALTDAVQRPVTVKIRAGINEQLINAVEIARLAEEAGAAAIAIHGRTQKQGYSGQANWEIIRQVKEAVAVPVIGNGDVFTPETFQQRLEQSGVDAIMIARGAIGNPYVFTQINDYLRTGEYEPGSRLSHFSAYLDLALTYDLPFSAIKSHAASFTKGLPGSTLLRDQMAHCKDVAMLQHVLQKYEPSTML